jgi:hypothetical protein
MTAEQLAVYRECTGRTEAPMTPATEGWLVCGRRSGKSFILALCAVFLACFRSYSQHLAPGERATIMVIAADRKQARVILRYIRGLLTGVEMLARRIERETAEGFDLTGSVTIEVATASFRTVRGYTLAAVLLDEIAFFPTDDAADADHEVVTALAPGLVTIPGSVMLCASSPYARRGVLWDCYRRHWAQTGDPILVWRAPTRVMNPRVPESVIQEACERDRASASAEWLAEFRSDLEDYISREQVERCVDKGVVERPPVRGVKYFSFTDPSGGSVDSMCGAVAHADGDTVVIDALREIPAPFDPESATAELATLFASYGITETKGDAYSSRWCAQAFERNGIRYEPSDRPKSALYVDLLPRLNAATVRLLDIPRVVNQIASLERRTARGGRDSIDHPPNHRDDLANVVAGVSAVTLSKWRRGAFSVSIIQADGRVVPYRDPSERVGALKGGRHQIESANSGRGNASFVRGLI